MKISIVYLSAVLITLINAQSLSTPITRGASISTITPKYQSVTTRKAVILKREAGFLEAEDTTEAGSEAGDGAAGEGAGDSDASPTEAATDAADEGVGESSTAARAPAEATNASEASQNGGTANEKTDNAQDVATTEDSISTMILSASGLLLVASMC